MATPRTTSSQTPKSASKTARSAPAKAKRAAAAPKAATAGKSTAKSGGRRAVRARPGERQVKRFDGKTASEPLALAFLMEQHREVEGYFKAYERASDDEEKAELSRKICLALKVHAQIEEELLYPEAHEKLDDEDLVDEAIVEHAGAKDLIAQIEAMSVGEHLYDAKVKVLSEYIKHHVCEEDSELFPKLRKAGMDLKAIGERLQTRSETLMREMEAGDSLRPSGTLRRLISRLEGMP